VAGAPASTIHTGAQQLQDAAASQEVEEKAAAPASSRSSFSIYPPVPGQESPLRWAGKKFEEIPIAHIKASYNNTLIQVVSGREQQRGYLLLEGRGFMCLAHHPSLGPGPVLGHRR